MSKAAKDIEVGDKLDAGSMVAVVESIRYVDETVQTSGGARTYTRKMITVAGQPEISAGNLQAFVDQGHITIISKEG